MKNSFNKVLSFMLALVMIVGCFSSVVVSAADDDCKHNPETDKVTGTVAATCAKPGSTTYECATCGKTYTKVIPTTDEHTGLVNVPASEPTCTESAYSAGTFCMDCMAKKDGTPDWDKVAEAYANGDKTVVPAVKVEGSKMLGHDFVQYVIESENCAEPTISDYKCSRCEKTVAQVVDDKEDETDKTGLENKYPKKELKPAGKHDYIVEVVTKAAKCTDAVTKLTCKDCGAEKTVVSTATNHVIANMNKEGNTIDLLVNYKGGCGNYDGGYYCTECNKQWFAVEGDGSKVHSAAVTVTTLDVTNATLISFVTKYNSDKLLDGDDEKFLTAEIVRNAVVEAGYTTEAALKANAPTCTEAGKVVKYCHDCGVVFEAGAQATDHEGLHVEIITFEKDSKIYCNNEVALVKWCDDCTTFDPAKKTGTTLDVVVMTKAVEHVWEDDIDDPNSVPCGTMLSSRQICSNRGCGITKTGSETAIGTKAHTYGDPVPQNIADYYDCTKDAKVIYTCTALHADPAHESEYEDGIYNEDGTLKYPLTCSADKNTKTETVREAVVGAHDINDNHGTSKMELVTFAATCQRGAFQMWICSVCGTADLSQGNDGVLNQQEATDPKNHETFVLRRSTVGADGKMTDPGAAGAYGKGLVYDKATTKHAANAAVSNLYQVTKWPTCEADGAAQVYCDCGEIVNAVIVADGHQYDELVVYVGSDGKVVGSHGATLTGKSQQSWAQWKESDQTWKVVTDTVASKEIYGAGHKKVVSHAVKPSCAKSGQTAGTCCVRCGEIGIAPKEVKLYASGLAIKSNHGKVNDVFNYESQTVESKIVEGSKKVVPASCMSDGYTSYYCSACCKSATDRVIIIDEDHPYTESNAAKWHGNQANWVDPTSVKKEAASTDIFGSNVFKALDPDCKDAGNYAYGQCATCKAIVKIWTCTETCIPVDLRNDSEALADLADGYYNNCTNKDHIIAQNSKDPTIAKDEHTWEFTAGTDTSEWGYYDVRWCVEPIVSDHKTCTECGAKNDQYVVSTPKHTMVKFVESVANCATGTYGVARIAVPNSDPVTFYALGEDDKYCSVCCGDGTYTKDDLDEKVPFVSCVKITAPTHRDERTYSEMNSADCTAASITTAKECVVCGRVVIVAADIKYPTNTTHNWGFTGTEYTIATADGTGTNGKPYKKGQIVIVIDADKGQYDLYEDKDGKSYYSCEFSMENTVNCTRKGCEATNPTGKKTELKAHYYINPAKEEVVIELGCDKIDAHLGQVCEICGAKVARKAEEGADPDTKYLFVEHTNYQTDTQKPTCTDKGFTVEQCLDCGEIISQKTIDALGFHKIAYVDVDPAGDKENTNKVYSNECTKSHAHDSTTCGAVKADDGKYYIGAFDITKKIESTKGAKGVYTYYCSVCKQSVELERDALNGVDLKFVPVSVRADLIRVDVLASAVDVKFNTITFTLSSKDGVIVSSKRATINAAAFVAADNVTIKQTTASESIEVTLFVPSDVKNSTLTANETVIASIYFDVNYTAKAATNGNIAVVADSAKLTAINTSSDIPTVTINEFGLDTRHETVNPQYPEYAVNNVALTKFKPVVVGDINGNDLIDAADVASAATLGYTGEYAAALDFNNDGIVNIADYVAVSKFVASAQTYADYLELIGIDYLAIVNAYNQALMTDLNGDGKIDETDRTFLGLKVLEKLQSIPADRKDLMKTVNEFMDDVFQGR